jgi:hypothetical protein
MREFWLPSPIICTPTYYITREDFIHLVRHRDGGAHLDADLQRSSKSQSACSDAGAAYQLFQRNGVPGIEFAETEIGCVIRAGFSKLHLLNGVPEDRVNAPVITSRFRPIPYLVESMMRQIGFEIEQSFRQYGY